jgi:uncharacterized DUF497 family protein
MGFMIEYEWDEAKYFLNLEKHKADFIDARYIYEHKDKITLSTTRDNEIRYMDIAPFNNRLMVLIYIIRETRIKIISFRKANNPKEINLYDHIKNKTL